MEVVRGFSNANVPSSTVIFEFDNTTPIATGITFIIILKKFYIFKLCKFNFLLY
jgi:hypothetical protein